MELKEVYRLASIGAYEEYKEAEKEFERHPDSEYLKDKVNRTFSEWIDVTNQWMNMN